MAAGPIAEVLREETMSIVMVAPEGILDR